MIMILKGMLILLVMAGMGWCKGRIEDCSIVILLLMKRKCYYDDDYNRMMMSFLMHRSQEALRLLLKYAASFLAHGLDAAYDGDYSCNRQRDDPKRGEERRRTESHLLLEGVCLCRLSYLSSNHVTVDTKTP